MTEPVLSVNLMISLGIIGTVYIIYKILLLAHQENVSIQNQKDS